MKRKMTYQEKYKKGVILDPEEIKDIINDNIDNIRIELISRSVYDDNTEEMIISIKV
jgi:hypothetical protein